MTAGEATAFRRRVSVTMWACNEEQTVDVVATVIAGPDIDAGASVHGTWHAGRKSEHHRWPRSAGFPHKADGQPP